MINQKTTKVTRKCSAGINYRLLIFSYSCTEYPNYGIGSFASLTLHWKNQYSLLHKIKVYDKSSEVFRHNSPFADVWHAALSFPFQSVKSLFSSAPALSKRLENRLKSEEEQVSARTHYNRAEALYSQVLPDKAYGPRVELTLQNATLEELTRAYDALAEFAEAVVCLFNVTKAIYQCGLAPKEILRCCPIQAVQTETLCSIPRMFTRSIANYFYSLLQHITSGKFHNPLYLSILLTNVTANYLQAFAYNDHFVRLAFLLQDQLTFIWSGSVQSLLHPTLFTRYKQPEAVFEYGHFYVSKELLVPSLDFAKARLYAVYRENETDNDEVDLLDVGLPRQFIYKIFPDASDQQTLNEILTNVRLCLCSSDGVVSPKDRSISSILAANLVNSLFAALFSAANIVSSSKKAQFVKLLQGKDRDAIKSFLERAYLTQTSSETPIEVRAQ